uniref:RNA polymerase sigma-70 factor n=1 Tax=Nostoc flagelliforme str. Sunitezuoqi TaxID=676037 RepID=E7DPS2_9NOSO|nr:RNA polymerase sigma-70 factor [Nostoc flagelliforme str. Sunitezuoqi]
MNNEPPRNNSQKLKVDNTKNNGQIGQAGRDLYQTQTNYIIRFFKLLSEQALKDSIIGVFIGLSRKAEGRRQEAGGILLPALCP